MMTLKEARLQKQLSQAELGQLIGLPQPAVSFMENGKLILPVKDRHTVEEALNAEGRIIWEASQ